MEADTPFDAIINFIQLDQVFRVFRAGCRREIIFDPAACNHIYFKIPDAVAAEFDLYRQGHTDALHLACGDAVFIPEPVGVFQAVLKCFFRKDEVEGIGAQVKMFTEAHIHQPGQLDTAAVDAFDAQHAVLQLEARVVREFIERPVHAQADAKPERFFIVVGQVDVTTVPLCKKGNRRHGNQQDGIDDYFSPQ